MTSRERVIDVIEHRKPDRIPLYGWVKSNLKERISEEYGSVEAFEDYFEFDLAHLFGGPKPFGKEFEAYHEEHDEAMDPATCLDMPLTDPNNESAYENIKNQIRHHKEERNRFVYVQTPGIFECLNKVFGIENHLCYLALYENELSEVYRRQAEWNRAFAMNCLDLGVDMIHVSDDWGAQRSLMFSPDMWQRLIFPNHKVTCDAVKARGGYLSLHSDGNINQALDGIVELGYDVLHPYQESAEMDYDVYKEKYSDAFVIMGGLDVQMTLGFGNIEKLKSEIERVMRKFADGGLLFCTTHFVQEHCSMEELRIAFETAYELSREVT